MSGHAGRRGFAPPVRGCRLPASWGLLTVSENRLTAILYMGFRTAESVPRPVSREVEKMSDHCDDEHEDVDWEEHEDSEDEDFEDEDFEEVDLEDEDEDCEDYEYA